ncbi:MAG TPA: hexose kinase [Marmoricola sp.]|nr:hexose kinase [Marmoricola sp.]
MIVTLTANPSFDRTIELAGRLQRGGVLRADAVLEQAGGKGVNISRAATAAGVETVAVFPADSDSPFVTELEHDRIACRPVAPTGPVRVNLTLTEADGTTTKINSSGATADAGLLDRLRTTVTDLAGDARWVVLAGSLPPGAPPEWYAEVAAGLAGTPARVAVDTSDAPLAALADRLGAARPDVLKPNAEELALLTGDDPGAVEADPVVAASAAARLVASGAGAVLATLGGAGAVLVTEEGAWHAAAPAIAVVSTVGAGDSSLFGYLLGEVRGDAPADRLRLAVAYGSAAAGLPGTTIPVPHQVHPDLVSVRSLPTPDHATPVPAAPTD